MPPPPPAGTLSLHPPLDASFPLFQAISQQKDNTQKFLVTALPSPRAGRRSAACRMPWHPGKTRKIRSESSLSMSDFSLFSFWPVGAFRSLLFVRKLCVCLTIPPSQNGCREELPAAGVQGLHKPLPRLSSDASKGRSPSTFNPQGWLRRPEERPWRFLYQFTAVKIGFAASVKRLQTHFYSKCDVTE